VLSRIVGKERGANRKFGGGGIVRSVMICVRRQILLMRLNGEG
jgi:hypothetical protein